MSRPAHRAAQSLERRRRCIYGYALSRDSMPIVGEPAKALYGVASMPYANPCTSTLALTNATMPYAVLLANKGWKEAMRENASLRKGLNMTAGVATYQAVADSFGMPYQDAENFIG